MIKCSQCEFLNPDGNRFCQSCGTPLAQAIASEPQSSNPEFQLDILPLENIPVTEDITSAELISEASVDATATQAMDLANATDEMDTDPDLQAIPTEGEAPAAITEDIPVIAENLDTATVANTQSAALSPTAPDVKLLHLSHAGLTDVGRQREHNEDTFISLSQINVAENPAQLEQTLRGLFIVCDGMGGHAGGEVASAITITKITESFQPFWRDKLPGEQKLKEIIASANQTIYELNDQEFRHDTGRMGTTLAMLAVYNTDVLIAHVGDSRVYKISDRALEQITRDHEVANRLIDNGVSPEIAFARADAHQLTQALGPNANHQINPTVQLWQLQEPTLFLLCSDGLCDHDVVEQNWETHLLPLLAPDADLKLGVRKLIELGNTLNGHDNITAILVKCEVESLGS